LGGKVGVAPVIPVTCDAQGALKPDNMLGRNLFELNQNWSSHMKLFAPLPRLLPSFASAAFALFLASSPLHAQSGGTFNGLGGNWSGTGTIFVSDGGSERIRCRAIYEVGPDAMTLKQDLKCASDSYKFELTTDLRSSGHDVYGNWTETSRNVNGEIHGTGGNGQFTGRVEANGYVAEISLNVSGGKQTINITSKSTELRGLNISMSKS
jgi:hypothetical protein